MNPRYVPLIALLIAGFLSATVPSHASSARQEDQGPDLHWDAEISEVPLVDLSGSWSFLADESDPMVEVWRGREILYVVTQSPDRIVLDFRPEDGRRNAQGYRWDGTIAAFERGDAQVRERARWTDGGRTLVVEGRWWDPTRTDDVNAYTFRYRLDGPDVLEFTQRDEYGETVWRFARR